MNVNRFFRLIFSFLYEIDATQEKIKKKHNEQDEMIMKIPINYRSQIMRTNCEPTYNSDMNKNQVIR